MLDQTSVKKARRALSRKLQTALETHLALIKKHVDAVSAAVDAGDDEPEDLVKQLLDGGNPLWNATAMRVISSPREALNVFDKAVKVVSEQPTGEAQVYQVYFQEETLFHGETNFENGAVMPTEFFVGIAKEIFDALSAAGLKPVYHRKNGSVAYLEIHW
jgi:hypothetical protein